MEQLVIEVAKAVPALLVLAWVVDRFLRALKERDDAAAARAVAETAALKAIAESANATQKETNELLGRLNSALDETNRQGERTRAVLHQTQEVLRETSANRG